MNCRLPRWIGVSILSLFAATRIAAQENPAKRLASIVGVAVEEYAKAVDENGKLISKDEFDETAGFLSDARQIATRLNSYNAATARAVLDSLITIVSVRRPPSAARELYRHFAAALGTAGAMDLPKAPLDTVEGHRLFATNCASCHGMTGAGDGPSAHTLSTAPPPIGVKAQSPELTPTLAYNVVSVGVRGTAMPAFASTLTPQQRWNIINYVYSLRREKLVLPVARADATAIPGDTASPVILALLDSALDFARSGKAAEAGDRAFDAYIAFEPLETSARAKKPGLVSTMEKHFADFKGAVRRSLPHYSARRIRGDFGHRRRGRVPPQDGSPGAAPLDLGWHHTRHCREPGHRCGAEDSARRNAGQQRDRGSGDDAGCGGGAFLGELLADLQSRGG
jgi:high-affinity iron transporter